VQLLDLERGATKVLSVVMVQVVDRQVSQEELLLELYLHFLLTAQLALVE
jgi:hypothetical protein